MIGEIAAAGAGLIGKGIDAATSYYGAEKAWDRQKKVLQNQIQWKVQDAVKAGLHPLAGLGVNPASVGGQWAGTDFGSMGQDIGRAVEAVASPKDKSASALMQLSVERGNLENELLRTQIASQRMRLAQQGTIGVPGGGAGTIPTPFSTPGPVANKGLGQEAADDFGDFIGELYGIGNFVESKWPTVWQWMQRDDITPAFNAALKYFSDRAPKTVHGYNYTYGSGGR